MEFTASNRPAVGRPTPEELMVGLSLSLPIPSLGMEEKWAMGEARREGRGSRRLLLLAVVDAVV